MGYGFGKSHHRHLARVLHDLRWEAVGVEFHGLDLSSVLESAVDALLNRADEKGEPPIGKYSGFEQELEIREKP